MKLDSIYLLYENTNKIFSTYSEAYFNSKKIGSDKTVFYVFTPTFNKFKYVGDLYKFAQEFFDKHYEGFYLNPMTKQMYQQLKLM